MTDTRYRGTAQEGTMTMFDFDEPDNCRRCGRALAPGDERCNFCQTAVVVQPEASVPQVFDLQEGRALRDEAVRRVDAAAEMDWKGFAFYCLQRLCMGNTGSTLSADDVVKLMQTLDPDLAASAHEPRAMGAVFTRAKRAKLITPTSEFAPTARTQGHAGPRRVWRIR